MKLTEWIESVSNDYTIQHIDELNGVIIAQLNNEYYLVKTTEVKA